VVIVYCITGRKKKINNIIHLVKINPHITKYNCKHTKITFYSALSLDSIHRQLFIEKHQCIEQD